MTRTSAPSAAPTAAARDLRTPEAAALDDMIAWLQERVPDRFPPDWHPLYGTKSLAADRAAELAARLERKYGRLDRWRRDLKAPLDKVRHGVLADKLDREALAEARRAIDAAIHAIEHPEVPPPPTADLIELARDVDIKLPSEYERARRLVEAALVAHCDQDGADSRARGHWSWLLGGLGCGEVAPPIVARARHALAGYGLPAVRPDDRVFAMTPEELCPPAPQFEPSSSSMSRLLPRWLDNLGLECGQGPRPREPQEAVDAAEIRRAEIQRERTALEVRRSSGDLRTSGKMNAPDEDGRREQRTKTKLTHSEYEKARQDLRKAESVVNAELDRHRHEAYIAWHRRIVDALDAALVPLRKTEPGSLKCWWLRELRRHAAMNHADRGLDVTGDILNKDTPDEQLIAMCVVKSFAIVLGAVKS